MYSAKRSDATTTIQIDSWIELVMNLGILSPNQLHALCGKVNEILIAESNVKDVPLPCTIVGDIHGQFIDLLELFEIAGKPPLTNFLFLGDFVDRGFHQVETITLLFLLKVRYPDRITLIRGNHECRSLTTTYGFQRECKMKYDQSQDGSFVWNLFLESFDHLPLAAIVGGRLFCVHGGLSPDVQSIDHVRILDRFQDLPHDGPMADLLWSDPDDAIDGFFPSSRGAGYLFGEKVTNAFLRRNQVTHIVRAHQLCNEGYRLEFHNTVVTVWSAPDYCYRCRNIASVLEVDENMCMYFNTFYQSHSAARAPRQQDVRYITNQYFADEEKDSKTSDPRELELKKRMSEKYDDRDEMDLFERDLNDEETQRIMNEQMLRAASKTSASLQDDQDEEDNN
ncbi:MAG: putative Serine/threonine-protein phosphatase PP-X [Streblomastix strix]|uniref:Serine/threonine-protein phosphatase n=1 Tax=Streblomastix strix TaxID=222440 RepID=A0A5J4WN31_9EUKA|nr:MAG: putative Serine/threonine-protein phosphatase PP-X [Streblomastix strix]